MVADKKGNVVDAFVAGAKKGIQISLNATIPNVVFAFVLIQVLNTTGLLDLIGNVFTPLMAIFGLPGEAATVLMGAFMSMGGGVGVAAGLLGAGTLDASAVPVLLPAIYLMGSQVQFIGRVLGAAEVPSKYTPHLVLISIINALLAMLVMSFFF